MSNKVLEIGKWGLIVLLSVAIIILWKGNNELNSSFQALKKDGTYIAAYQSQTINELKKENSELYNSIKKLKDVKQAVIIKYKYIYHGDTIYVDRVLPPIEDSIYTFSEKSDTLSYDLKVKADSVEWYKLNFTLNEKFTIINRENAGHNETTITTGTGGGTITDAQFYNKKSTANNFFNRFSIGVQAGVGYGIITKKPDIYVGVGVAFRLTKAK